MIRNETEYQAAVARLKEEKKRITEQEKRLAQMKLSAAEIKRAIEPMLSFHLQLEEEVEGYEKLKRGDLGEFKNLHGIGRALVALRIAFPSSPAYFSRPESVRRSLDTIYAPNAEP